MGVVGPSTLDVAVGAISGLTWPDVLPWVNSLRASGFLGKRVLLHVGADADTLRELDRSGVETWDARQLHRTEQALLQPEPKHEDVSVNRFFYVWHFLNRVFGAANARYVVFTDVRDVVFQRNPSEWLERHLGTRRLVVGSESLCFADEPWGSQTVRDCFGPLVWEDLKASTIYNAGTIAGEFRTMVELSQQVFLVAPGRRVPYSDQAALNLLLRSAAYRELTCFAPAQAGWACQAGTTADPRVIGLRPLLLEPEPHFDGDAVRTAAGEKFVLVHQYDRVPEWKATFQKKFA